VSVKSDRRPGSFCRECNVAGKGSWKKKGYGNLNLDVFDSDGKRRTPRESFIVPLHIIETAVELLLNGEIVHYRYDEQKQEIVERKYGRRPNS
jgi:hypothetical protein